MIANITTIMYILSVSDENTNSGILQKGTAISRINDEDGYLTYKFYCYLAIQDDDTASNTVGESEIVQPFKEENVYLITGKFSTTQDGSLYITITTNIFLSIDKEDIPISKPTVHLLGKTQAYAELSEVGYSLPVQVKPYLSKDHFYPFTVNFTHPPNGRFRNAFTKAKKNSTVYATGILFLVNNKLHCEVLEFQFVATTKSEMDNDITVPWKLKNDQSTEKISSKPTKSAIEQRIALIRQNSTTQSSSSIINPESSSNRNKKRNKLPMSRIVDISKSFIDNKSNNNDQEENQEMEIEEIVNDNIQENTDDNSILTAEINEEDTSSKTKNKGRGKRKRNIKN